MPTAPPTRCCPACGTANKAFTTFCYECGESLDDRQAEATPGQGGRAAGPLRRWEVWLGLALVAAVLGFAVLDWSQREAQARQYHSGEAAVAARHWDAALAVFGALGTYRDAPRRKTDVAAQIQARDSAYRAGLTAVAQMDGVGAYRAFSQTVAIEPDYRDAPARLAAATQELSHAILADTIYRRTDGGSPGLYLYRASGGDSWLPGSDAQSNVRSFGPAGGPVVYDGPIPGTTPDASASTDNFYNGGPLPADRQALMVDETTLLAGGHVVPTVLPRALSESGYVYANPRVLWDPSSGSFPPQFSLGTVRGGAVNNANYYDLRSGQRGQLTSVAPAQYMLLDLDSKGKGGWLLGHYGSPHDPPYQTTLYLFGGDGDTLLQPVAQVAGVIYEAHTSPDGHYLVYTVADGDAGQPDLHLDMVLLDLRDPTPVPRTIESLPLGQYGTARSLQMKFIPNSDPPQVLIRRLLTDDKQLSRIQLDLWSLSTGTARRIWESPVAAFAAGSGYTAGVYWLAPDGTSLTITVPDGKGHAHLLWQPLDGAHPATQLGLPPDPVVWWQPVFPDKGGAGASDYLFYYIVNRESLPRGRDTLLYGVPAADPAASPVLLFTLNADVDSSTGVTLLPTQLLTIQGAGKMVQIRTLDGSLALPTLPGIDQILPHARTPHDPQVLYPWNN